MKKHLFFIIFIAISFFKLSAQPILYGVTQFGGSYNGGTLFQFDATTYDFQVKKDFNVPANAAVFKGKLLLASNHKLYGIGAAELFEFDPATGVYNKKADFVDSTTGSFSIGNLVQLPNGKIIGTCVVGGLYGYGTIWEFDITSSTITKLYDFDNSITGGYPQSGVASASNGKLYGTTNYGGLYNFGTLWEFAPQTNSLIVKYNFDNTTGAYPFGYLKSGTSGKLYGVCSGGGTANQGTLFEYDITASVLTKRVDFDGTNGAGPLAGLNQASNGLFYGTTVQGGQYAYGTLYSFDPVSGTISILHDFNYDTDGITNNSVIQVSNGKLYGLVSAGANNFGSIYEYNINSSTYSTVFNFDNTITGGFPFQSELIEVSITDPCANFIASSSAGSINCNGGAAAITISANGGTAPYSGTGNLTRTAGTYSFVVTDANGCIANTTVVLTEPTLLTASASAGAIICNGDSTTITVSASGGTAPYAGVGNLTGMVAGTYSLTVTDANGCAESNILTVTEPVRIITPPALFEEWAVKFAGTNVFAETSVITDKGGNVLVTGTTKNATGEHLVTLKYSNAGELQWSTTRIDNSRGRFIATDNNNNVYLAGTAEETNNFIIVKYNAAGTEQWTSTYVTNNSFEGLNAMSIDNNANVYVTGTSETNTKITTLKYNANGVQQWATKYNTQTGTAKAIAINNNDVYITGYTTGANANYITIKYNINGAQQWAIQYNGTGNSNDEANAITIDKNGNIYVAGKSMGNGNNFDFATIKYNSNGIQQWVNRYNGIGNSTDEAKAIIADANNNVYVTGYTTNAAGNEDYSTISYSSGGQSRWIQNYNGAANDKDYATAIAIDGKNNIIVTGTSIADLCSGLDYTTIKYQQNGTLQWTQRYNSTANKTDISTALAVDANNNVFITGYSGSITGFDFATVKYVQKDFPIGYDGVMLNNTFGMLEFVNETAFKSVMEQLIIQNSADKGDNGNTPYLLNLLNSNTPPAKIKTELIASSPLSDVVLLAAINKNLPPGIIKDILIANTSFTDVVENAITQSSLPQGIKDQVMSAANSDFVIENAVFDRFETLVQFHSLRKDLEKNEELFLKNGGDPESSSSPDNHLVKDDYLRTVLNPQLEVKVGKTILKYLDTARLVQITSGSLATLNRVRQNDITVFTNLDVTIDFLQSSAAVCDADFTMSAIGNTTIVFTSTSTGDHLNYSWNFGGGATSTLQNPTHTFPSAVTSTSVCLTITNNLTGCWSRKCKDINIQGCTADFSFFISNNSIGNFQNFSVGGATNYLWNFGDGATSTQFAPSHTYAQVTQNYTVCLTITNTTGCFSKLCKTISINFTPAGCCDKNDKEKEVWNSYATKRKAKATLTLGNILFYHHVSGKTKNYKKGITGAWSPKKAEVSAEIWGTIYGSTTYFLNWHTQCDAIALPQIYVVDVEPNWWKANAHYWNGGNNPPDRIFLKQGSVGSLHKVKYNGTDYPLGPLFLTEDCP